VGWDEHVLRVRAVEKWIEVRAELLLPAAAGRAGPAGRRVRGHDSLPGSDVDAAELVPEWAGQLAEQDRVAPVECLRIGAVGQSDLDLDDDVAPLGLRLGDVFQPEVAGPVEEERPHGVKTTLSASPLVYASNPSAKRSSGRMVVGSGARSGRRLTAARRWRGVPDRQPTTWSSRR
jgi:hypothetical protein